MRNTLNLVDDGSRVIIVFQKPPGIAQSKLPRIRIFQIDIGLFGKKIPGQGGFSGLARTDDGHDGKFGRDGFDFQSQQTLDHDGVIIPRFGQIDNQIYNLSNLIR